MRSSKTARRAARSWSRSSKSWPRIRRSRGACTGRRRTSRPARREAPQRRPGSLQPAALALDGRVGDPAIDGAPVEDEIDVRFADQRLAQTIIEVDPVAGDDE